MYRLTVWVSPKWCINTWCGQIQETGAVQLWAKVTKLLGFPFCCYRLSYYFWSWEIEERVEKSKADSQQYCYYKKVKASQLWERILQYRRNEFPNICLLVEIVIAVGMSNSVVESCFCFLSAMLSDRRLSLKHNNMEIDLILIINANHYLWSEEERN